jgi:hypothetical protein
MKKKNTEKIEKKRINIFIPSSLLKELNIHLVNKYVSVWGHIGESFEEGLRMWLDKEKLEAQGVVE